MPMSEGITPVGRAQDSRTTRVVRMEWKNVQSTTGVLSCDSGSCERVGVDHTVSYLRSTLVVG